MTGWEILAVKNAIATNARASKQSGLSARKSLLGTALLIGGNAMSAIRSRW
jgi:hypothetical protein